MKTTDRYKREHAEQRRGPGQPGGYHPTNTQRISRLLYRPSALHAVSLPGKELTDDDLALALESGELVTAHRAAKAVGVHVGTFNYHLRQGRIPHLATPGGVRYVRLDDARAFADKLAAWRAGRSFEQFEQFEQVEQFEQPGETPAEEDAPASVEEPHGTTRQTSRQTSRRASRPPEPSPTCA